MVGDQTVVREQYVPGLVDDVNSDNSRAKLGAAGQTTEPITATSHGARGPPSVHPEPLSQKYWLSNQQGCVKQIPAHQHTHIVECMP